MDEVDDKAWSQNSNNFRPVQLSMIQGSLPPGLYTYHSNPMSGWWLERTSDGFQFPFKVYGNHQNILTRVKRAWSNMTGNMGVLLNGNKGAGKTVCVQEIANWAIGNEVPVIAVYGPIPIVDVLTAINQDVLIIFDEFEKTHAEKEQQQALLTAVDGMTRSKHKRLFLFTTNTKNVEENFLDRPSRIRYLWEFGNLSEEVVSEIVDDMLKPELRKFKADIMTYVMTRRIVSIDIVRAVINEVNVFEESPEMFKAIMNISERVVRSFEVVQLDTALNPIRTIVGFLRPRTVEIARIQRYLSLDGRMMYMDEFGPTNPMVISDASSMYVPRIYLKEPFLMADDPQLWVASVSMPVEETWYKAYPKFHEEFVHDRYLHLDAKPEGWRVPEFVTKVQRGEDITHEERSAAYKLLEHDTVYGGPEALQMLVRISPNYDFDTSRYKFEVGNIDAL